MTNKIYFLLSIAVGIIFFLSCERKIQKDFLTKLEPILEEYDASSSTLPGQQKLRSVCRDKMNYIPDPNHLEFTPLKIIRVNIHIMRNSKGGSNFPNEEQGRIFVKKVLESTNQKLEQNAKMFLPLNNDTPKLPQCYKFELSPRPNDPNDDGIYFHDDDELFYMTNYGKNTNIYKQGVYKKYGIQKDTVMNIFMMGVHQDSIESKTYKMVSNGIAFGKWTKVASWYYFMNNKNFTKASDIDFIDHWTSQRLWNHEIGHCLGLRHSWVGNDGCDDTPSHQNCWNYTKNGSKCDSIVSNNIMDYTAHAGAWSPCQIATVHYNLSNKKYRIRPLLKKTWCKYDESKTININKGEDIVWKGAKDLEGNIIVKDGASLTIHCRVSIPPNGKIIVEPKGKLVLNGATLENDCGETWKGIEVWSTDKRKGEVVMVNDAKITEAENPIDTAME